MSESESFIDEVTDEVRRDKLFALMKRYGWIAILAVVLLVAGAAYNEWRKAQDIARAEALGDSLLAALALPDSSAQIAALEKITPRDDARAVVALLLGGEARPGADGAPASADAQAAAAKALQSVIDDARLPQLYRDLARLKLVMLEGPKMDKATRLAALKALDVPGAPFRLLAEEQLAVIDIENGDQAAAIARLKDIVADNGTSARLRQRAMQVIVALGGKLDAA